MRKPIIFMALIMTLILVLAGCSGDSEKEVPVQEDTTEMENEVVEEPIVEIEEEVEDNMDKDDENPFANISNMDEYYYEMETQVGGELISTSKIWVSGNKSRFESQSPYSNDIAIIIANDDEGFTYIYTPAQNMATKMPFDSAEIIEDPDSDENIDFVENFKILSDDENITIENGDLEGEPVKIIIGDYDGDTTKTWVSTKTGFPLKSEYYADGNLESATLFKGFNNDSIDPSMFELPDGVQIIEMPQQP